MDGAAMKSLDTKQQRAATARKAGARELGTEARQALRPHRLATSVAALALLSGALACSAQVGPTGATHGSGGSAMGGSGGNSPGGTGAMPGSGGNSPGGSGAMPGSSGHDGNPGSGGTGGAAGSADPVIAAKAIHRLSNVEYDNTIRDLLHTDPGLGKAFISEEADGFDNIATALSMSPRQVEDYFVAARQISASVFADSKLRGQLVSCDPAADTACPSKVITSFGARAYRRPLSDSETKDLLAKYDDARKLGTDAMGALQHVVHIMLASPPFLYRIELDADLANTTAHALNGYELASRLSYALWSSMPDDTLFALAKSGDLSNPDTLSAQVDRMLDDSRSDMLAQNFAAQWFGSKRLPDHAASATLFPAWNAKLAASMQREMELYFSEFLRGDLSFTDFLSTDMNFVDPALAKFYGFPAGSGTAFQRVVNTTDHRQGFLGLAGFLTHTSRETRTSPIIRGKWILDAVWCLPLQVPTNLIIDPLPEPADGAGPTTVRELMAAHRAAAACAPCHDMIDPIGLALEHFDGIGSYRETYEGAVAIDTVGTLPGGATVDGLSSLSNALANDPRFMTCATQKFGTFAMGLSMADANRDQVLSRWMSGKPTLRNLIKETVRHQLFRMRRAEGQ